jgi:hypothetical protein
MPEARPAGNAPNSRHLKIEGASPEIRCYRTIQKGAQRSIAGMAECFVAKASDLKDGDRRIVVSGQHEVGVFFKDGSYYAYSN